MASVLSLRNTLMGRSLFLTDMFAPNMLYALTIRCERPHARIIETRLPDLPRDVSYLRAADIPGVNYVDVFGEIAPILAEREGLYRGEPLGLLIGPSPARILEISKQIQVSYETLEAATDLDDERNATVVVERTKQRGNIEKALRTSSQLVEGRYRTGIQDHLYSEPIGAYASAANDGTITVFSPSQWPHHVRNTVAAVLDMPESACRVRSTELGVHLDGKLWYPSVVAAQAALASRHTGKPVKLLYNREEDFCFSPKGIQVRVDYISGLDEQGNLSAADIQATINLGAYPLFTEEIVTRVAAALVAHYRCDTLRLRIRALRTNLPPLNACSGLGNAHAAFAVETHISRLAELTQTSPIDWKRRNLLRRGQTPLIGDRLTANSDQHDLLGRAAAASDFERKFAAFELQKKRRRSFSEVIDPPRGIGIAFSYQASGFSGQLEEQVGSTVRVRVEKDGSAELLCGAVSESDAVRSVWRQNLSTVLNIADTEISFASPDTEHTTDCGPAVLSRNMVVIQRTIETACNAIKRQRFRAPLPLEVRRTFRLSRTTEWDAQRLHGQPHTILSHAAAVVEVEVSPVTYETAVRGVWIVVDAGRILQREQATRVLERGVYAALGWAGAEEVTFTDGALSRDDYHRYQHSRFTTTAPITIEFVGDGEKSAARGLGELPMAVIPAAFALAVTQATGRYIDTIPCTPETLRSYLEEDA
ncbi:MAG: xanthine dehydrogenase family protein molybdopterin-binding subunit [Spirochaetaceae bacterium]|nr:MAG: xanthine dehydrogenase family protein molybdopterin-binding subunit [Spirochaetaceae bacterium]